MTDSVESLSFSDYSPEEKLKLGKTLGKVISVAGKVLPIASQFVPVLVPINAAVQAGKQVAQVLKH
jgi:hypothetical protein